MERTWSYWTEQKLEMLAAYLPQFTTASVRLAGPTTYLDLFAGDTRNLSRTTGQEINGSPIIALDTQPPFGRVHLFELPAQAARLEAELRTQYAGRDLRVWAGDCNQKIDEALDALAPHRGAPTFALIDQYAAEIHWTTLRKLASFKQRSPYKVEMWMLFAHSMLPRGLTTSTFEARVDAMFGCHDWAKVYEDRRANLIPAAVLRDQLTNLMRWRLERVLGYKRTHAFEMKNHGGSPIYTMIFATDNAAGDRIMTHIYGQAAEKQPQMRAEAVAQMQAIKEEEAGTPGLFPPLPRATPTAKLYRHTSPTRPYGKNLCTDCAVQPTG